MEDDEDTLYLVLHSKTGPNGKPEFRALATVYDTWEEADKRAKQTALDFKVTAWVIGFERPKLTLVI